MTTPLAPPGWGEGRVPCLALLDGRELAEPVAQAMRLLATVLGQDLETGEDGVLRIARRVAPDRIISTVDSQTRHGHKTAARGFDGYKGHLDVDPDSEIITDTEVTAGNVGDVAAAPDLIDDILQPTAAAGDGTSEGETNGPGSTGTTPTAPANCTTCWPTTTSPAGARPRTRSPPEGRFAKNQFDIDLDDDTVTCPNGVTAPIRRNKADHGQAAPVGYRLATPNRSPGSCAGS